MLEAKFGDVSKTWKLLNLRLQLERNVKTLFGKWMLGYDCNESNNNNPKSNIKKKKQQKKSVRQNQSEQIPLKIV